MICEDPAVAARGVGEKGLAVARRTAGRREEDRCVVERLGTRVNKGEAVERGLLVDSIVWRPVFYCVCDP
jgi:hypothetical protein